MTKTIDDYIAEQGIAGIVPGLATFPFRTVTSTFYSSVRAPITAKEEVELFIKDIENSKMIVDGVVFGYAKDKIEAEVKAIIEDPIEYSADIGLKAAAGRRLKNNSQKPIENPVATPNQFFDYFLFGKPLYQLSPLKIHKLLTNPSFPSAFANDLFL